MLGNTTRVTRLQTEVKLNTAKVTDLVHPLVETAVPIGALFTDTNTVYDDTAIQNELDNKVEKITQDDMHMKLILR